MSLSSFVPPMGTVTFLFTDIEGSTALWERQPDAMQAALAHHDRLLTAAITAENGFVFKTIGDAFCAAFATAREALAAALNAQIALLSEPSALPTPLRVRMGLHTGAAELRESNYFGQPLNRVARLMSAGHGGQILMSIACQELTRDTLPSTVTLRDLGLHRLKDLSRSEQVFQVLHPKLPDEFPPLRSLNNPDLPNNLPQQMTSFIGREAEVAEIKGLLKKSRLLTLTGAGGAGKTRLALQAAVDVLDSSGDGVWQVELAPLADPTLVPQAVAEALGVREEPGRPIAKTLAEALKSKQLLVVLDNCEHVLAACAFLARDLMRACPNITILATSREALGVSGEQTYRVPSLSLPDPKQTYTAEALSQYEAVRLFIDRACLSHSAFTVTNHNAPAVTQICARLDGIPLAIELAAARVKALSVEQIGIRLNDRFHLLTGGSRTALPRQQTLKAAIDWSYDLLTRSEQTLLHRLSVFVGGWTLEAAEAICAAPQKAGTGTLGMMEDTLDLLSLLVDKSLVVYEEDKHGQSRYRLLETVRQYGHTILAESGEIEALSEQHQVFFLALTEQAMSEMAGSKQVEWLDRLELEHDNLRSALDWCLQGDRRQAEAGLRLSGALGTFWLVRGYLSEGQQWLSRTLERAEQQEVSEKIKVVGRAEQSSVWTRALTLSAGIASALSETGKAQTLFEQATALARAAGDQTTLAYALRGQGICRMSQETVQDGAAIQTLFEESLLLFQQVKDQNGIALVLRNLGDWAFSQGNYLSAQTHYTESLNLSRRLGHQHGVAGSRVSLARVAFAQGDLDTAWALNEEALPLSRQLGDKGAVASTLLNQGLIALTQGDLSRAKVLYEEALPLSRQLGLEYNTASALSGLGRVSAKQGDHRTAWALLAESLKLQRQKGKRGDIAESLEWLATLAHAQNQLVRAAQFLGAADLFRESVSARLPLADQQEHDRRLRSMREALGEEAFAAALAEGKAMTIDTAMEYALAGTDR